MNQPSLSKFFQDSQARSVRNNERFGQACFNHLVEVRPELAEQIRNTDYDPYYAKHGDATWNMFVQFVRANWNTD